MSRRMKRFALLTCLCAISCNTDASATKDAIGVWTWNPRTVLSPEKIVDAGFPTPTLEAWQLDADGKCVFVETVPGYDAVPEYWLEYRGTWSIAKGELTIDLTRVFGAAHRAAGWAAESTAGAPDMKQPFEVIEHNGHRLRLHSKAIGSYDRDLQKTTGLPQRPAL